MLKIRPSLSQGEVSRNFQTPPDILRLPSPGRLVRGLGGMVSESGGGSKEEAGRTNNQEAFVFRSANEAPSAAEFAHRQHQFIAPLS